MSQPPPTPQLLLEYQPRALARLALGTSVVIASLLTIPDSIALIANAPSLLSWMLRVLGVWISALVLWYVSFLGLLYLVKYTAGGVGVNSSGIKLWRLGKTVTWESLVAVSIEPQKTFSSLFGLPLVHRLNLFVRRGENKISPQFVPSYFFASEDFDQLCNAICRTRFGLLPDSQSVLITEADQLPNLRKLYRTMNWQRWLLTAVIGLSLVTFLGRTAVVNYCYGQANKEFKQEHYARALDGYRYVLTINPAFAPAWYNLANTEFQLGQREKAKEHWHRALFFKPDFVDAKVGLSYLYIHERQFDKAQELLDSALRLTPRNTGVLLNLADLNMHLGNIPKAMEYAYLVLSAEPNNDMAVCLVAQGRMHLGKYNEALIMLNAHPHLASNAFCKLVKGEIYMKLGNCDQAEALFQQVVHEAPQNLDARNDLELIKQCRKQ